MIQLFDDYWYSKFNGRNTLDIRVPNALLNRPKQPKTPTFIQDGKKKIEISSGSSLSKGTKIQVVGADNKKVPLKDGKYKVPQTPTNENPKPAPIEIEVKKGVITKTTAPATRGRMIPKNLQSMGFDNSLSFMEKNDWFRLEDPLSTVATTTLRKVMYKFTGTMRSNEKKDDLFLSFNETREYVRNLKFKNLKEFQEWSSSDKRPNEITSRPSEVFKDEFISWWDFLGVIEGWNGYMEYNELVKYIKPFNIKSGSEWNNYWKKNKKPDNIPAYPQNTYKKEWTSWGDFLGTGVVAGIYMKDKYVSYKEAEKFALKLKLKNQKEWYAWSKKGERPFNIPASPQMIYKSKGWDSWGKFLGTGVVADVNKVFLPYKKARKIIHSVGLKTAAEWREYSKTTKPSNIPSNPKEYYSKTNEWVDWFDWLGNKKK
jgi:hypothetical protein